ncbi:hypothetical protein VTL71DRAFT_2097 [Oculimacula yallundae]|uniref:Mucoidy inhibitor-like protein n=1 Tax=Oculimacula yallundae TaxID=86028 RepID=A0ABR4C7W9_9HELO
MATDTPHKLEFRIRDLSTRSVLLFPSRAQVIRDIKNVTLQPGANQIIIDGLSPLVDEHSIKVEGTGSATITDVTVDLLPNREVYEDIYPSDSEEEDVSEAEDSDVEVEEMKVINERIKKLRVQLLDEQEKINSAADRLKICDNFSKSVEKDRPAPADLDKLILAYHTERKKIYSDHEAATGKVEEIQQDIRKTEKAKFKLARALVKANEKSEKAKAKEREKKLRKKAEIAKEKQRIKAERDSFWPKKVYCITVNVEPSSFTPASTRRSSIDGDTIVNLATSEFHEASDKPLRDSEISLSLSYITYGASWSPRYDLSLNTVKSTGLLEYGAELKNTTSETWRDTKVILSTSQTTFSGLSETIPTLLPWHVHLEKGARNADSSLFSSHELQAKQKEYNQTKVDQSQKSRYDLFGRDNSARNAWVVQQQQTQLNKLSQRTQQAQQMMMRSVPQVPQAFGASFAIQSDMRSSAPTAGLFGAAPTARRRDYSEDQHHATGGKGESRFLRAEDDSYSDEDMGFGLMDDGPSAPKSLTFEEGAWEETGMTTTYDVPGTKTLSPNNSTIKHKIAKIDFKNVVFSHIVIGKLRQVAFLKARLRNTSKITLLKGPLGLTLDGSFLGQGTFPRCSAGESFSLPLGVDPALSIAYPKPTVRRSQTGIFTKEDCNVFSRSVVITNTKPNAAVDITVLDQVPVSEDERLKIEIANPRGLKVGGEAVRAGTSAFATSNSASTTGTGSAKEMRASVYGVDGAGKESASSQIGKWGTAVASVKKGGEITWNVKLNPGQGVRLALEYEATFPGGERVVGV